MPVKGGRCPFHLSGTLKEINAFYSTPAGKKLIQSLPDLIKKRDRLAMQRLQDNLGELEQEIQAARGQ